MAIQKKQLVCLRIWISFFLFFFFCWENPIYSLMKKNRIGLFSEKNNYDPKNIAKIKRTWVLQFNLTMLIVIRMSRPKLLLTMTFCNRYVLFVFQHFLTNRSVKTIKWKPESIKLFTSIFSKYVLLKIKINNFLNPVFYFIIKYVSVLYINYDNDKPKFTMLLTSITVSILA